jgi:adenine-specific DNA-methyltransferase
MVAFRGTHLFQRRARLERKEHCYSAEGRIATASGAQAMKYDAGSCEIRNLAPLYPTRRQGILCPETSTRNTIERRFNTVSQSKTVRTMRGIQQPLLFPASAPGPAVRQETKGVVYTKRWVVELLLDLAGYRPENNLVDATAVEPAAGEGAFLGPMIERLLDSCRQFGRHLSECRDSLIAFELDDESAGRARTLAADILLRNGVKRALAEDLGKAWIRTGDYLFEAISMEADFVVGNPPYVRLEDIPEQTAMLYRDAYPTMRGRADLYIAFFEAGLRQLKDGGICAFICADRWMRNQYGGELRKLATSRFSVDVVIEMHNADAFHDEVDAYPAITVIRRQTQGTTVVACAGPDAGDVGAQTLSAILLATARREPLALPRGLSTALVDTWFKGSGPWPCHSPGQLALLRYLEEHFPVLESYAKVGIGVATGNDSVFITKDTGLVERSRLLKLALASDIWEGTMKWSGHYLIDPWNGDGLVMLDKYPRLQGYFEKHGAALRNRHTAAKNVRGWYKTIDRVTHALREKPKLYIADIKNLLDPVLDNGETYPHHNLYFIQSDDWDLEILGGLLMSTIGQFFIESYGVRMRGGYLRFQAQYLRRIRVPDPKHISEIQAAKLKEAFRKRDRNCATRVALEVYGIDEHEMETALGH